MEVKKNMCIECCCGPPYSGRGHGYGKRFLTRAEKTEKLKEYAEELKKELTAVEEHIKELRD
ncbi:MAG: DUF5320 domain-containing protein [Candidatus Bathyarchaeum sp.]|nr:MAG: DUF5320 domain-containing protein [Candidatus Bathyarchaeum sp.]